MKKVVVAVTLGIVAAGNLQAQDLESSKKLLLLSKYKDAKTDIDKVVANPKFNTKPETWILKSAIYSGLSNTSGATKADSIALRKESFDALQKYSQLDPTNALATDPRYSDVSRQLYVAYFNSGINKFNSKDWQAAYDDLKSSSLLSEYLIKNKVLSGPIDTNSIMYTGAAAQNAKNDAEAVVWYDRLANLKVAGKDNEFIYQYLTDYYLKKKDNANFNKYSQLGKQLYPESKYFSSIGADYARSSTDFNDVVKFYEDKVTADPNNYDVNYDFGAEIFDHLYPRDTTKKPQGDVSQWEQKMTKAFEKAAEIKADKGLPLAVIGSHYAKKAEILNDQITAVGNDIKNANRGAKPDKLGKLPPVPKDLLTKKDALYKDYYSVLDQAADYYAKASERFGKQDKLEPIEKQFYKNAASNLIDIYSMKKVNAKGKPADIAKFAGEQKKWEGVYDSIK